VLNEAVVVTGVAIGVLSTFLYDLLKPSLLVLLHRVVRF
jgi:hypothetical protein